MNITLNGESSFFEKPLSVEEFVSLKNLNRERIVVELNREIIKKEEYKTKLLNDGDVLEIVNFVGGG